jgi:hypothetical protein
MSDTARRNWHVALRAAALRIVITCCDNQRQRRVVMARRRPQWPLDQRSQTSTGRRNLNATGRNSGIPPRFSSKFTCKQGLSALPFQSELRSSMPFTRKGLWQTMTIERMATGWTMGTGFADKFKSPARRQLLAA